MIDQTARVIVKTGCPCGSRVGRYDNELVPAASNCKQCMIDQECDEYICVAALTLAIR